MRHLKAGRALGVKPAHRKAMLRNLVTSLVEEERVKTTVSRAKELRKPLDKMITLGKKGDLSARRQALAFIKTKKAMAKLFGEFAERYADRNGGYTRIIRVAPRRGDGAEMALVILVGSEHDPFMEEGGRRRRGGAKKPKGKVIDKVAEDVAAEVTAEATSDAATAEAPAEEVKAEAEVTAEATPEVAAAEEVTAEAEASPEAAVEAPKAEEAETAEKEKAGE